MRIRWRGVARAAAIALVGLVVLRAVPSLLRTPEPPPLGRDVGLPKVRPAATVPAPVVRTEHHHSRHHHHKKKPSPLPARQISKAREPVESTPPPAREYVPPPAPEPIPTPLPEPPSAPESVPGDGSQEFAPH